MKKKTCRITFLALLLSLIWVKSSPPVKPVLAQSCQNSVGDDFSNLDKWSIRIKPDGSLQNKIETVSNYEGKPAVKHTLADPSGSTFMTYTLCQSTFGKVTIDFYDDGTDKGTLFVIYPQEIDFNRLDDPSYKYEVLGVGVWTGQDGYDSRDTDGASITYPSYVYRVGNRYTSVNSTIKTGIKRKTGWHKFELSATPVGAFAKIDGNNLVSLPGKKHSEGFTYNINTDTSFLQNGVRTIGIVSSWNIPSTNYFADLTFIAAPQFNYSDSNESLSQLSFDVAKYYLNQYPNSTEVSFYDEVLRSYIGFMAKEPNWRHWLTQEYVQILSVSAILAYDFRLNNSQDSLNKALNLFQFANTQYSLDRPGYKEEYGYWKECNGVPYEIPTYLFAAKLLWDKLDNVTRSSVVDTVLNEADLWLKIEFDPAGNNDVCAHFGGNQLLPHLPFQRPIAANDAANRDNGWTSAMFYLAGTFEPIKQKYPQKAEDYITMSKILAYHSLIRKDDDSYGVHPAFPDEGVIGVKQEAPTLYDNYDSPIVCSCPNPVYVLTTIEQISRGLLCANKRQFSDDEADAYFHNWQPVVERASKFIDFQTYRAKSSADIVGKEASLGITSVCDKTIGTNPGELVNFNYFSFCGEVSSFDAHGRGFQYEDFSHEVDTFASLAILPSEKTGIDNNLFRKRLSDLLKYEFYTYDRMPQMPWYPYGEKDNYVAINDSSMPPDSAVFLWGKGFDGTTGMYILSAKLNSILNGVTAINHLYAAYYLDPVSLPPQLLEGDLNNDFQVNSQDLVILLQNWGSSPANPRADLNSDGIVNGMDFERLRKLIL